MALVLDARTSKSITCTCCQFACVLFKHLLYWIIWQSFTFMWSSFVLTCVQGWWQVLSQLWPWPYHWEHHSWVCWLVQWTRGVNLESLLSLDLHRLAQHQRPLVPASNHYLWYGRHGRAVWKGRLIEGDYSWNYANQFFVTLPNNLYCKLLFVSSKMVEIDIIHLFSMFCIKYSSNIFC